ncbi:MAG: AmmeMemoRadiSam system protein B [Candidatus Omnitrophica bacterium]|nr:AmmeMemoRadiSam system protein B [Candidatus Omnitrophota bacterium]MDD5690732.1 AmmeMemoRadiSam system protein B [Candidatus Omnitrophota bacterium]
MKSKITLIIIALSFFISICFALSVKQPEFNGKFYPLQKEELSKMIDDFLAKAKTKDISGHIFMLISPHAGYGYSGQSAAYGYKLIKDRFYNTVIILGTSHHKPFNGVAVYAQGSFETSLGPLRIDDEFTSKLVGKSPDIFASESAFDGEHSVEVQLPFLQKVLTDFKIVPLVAGDCSLNACRNIASLLKAAIGGRKDVLLVVSSDLYHGYDINEAEQTDTLTLELIKKMDYEGLYYSLRDAKAQACGGFGTVIALDIAKGAGYDKVEVLNYTNSAIVTGSANGQWTVGYASIAVYNPEGDHMLNSQQRKKLLEIARDSIKTYLQTGKKLELNEVDPVLMQEMGAFVTLNKHGELRGCIGNLSGTQPLYLTVRDMAVEAAMDDPRFSALSLPELKDVSIEISVLSPLKKVDSADKIIMGKHGVLVRKGYQSGVFLPQVATETGWSKEEFLNNLCVQKAGLAQNAWKNKDTELYIFEAEVFSEGKQE